MGVRQGMRGSRVSYHVGSVGSQLCFKPHTGYHTMYKEYRDVNLAQELDGLMPCAALSSFETSRMHFPWSGNAEKL